MYIYSTRVAKHRKYNILYTVYNINIYIYFKYMYVFFNRCCGSILYYSSILGVICVFVPHCWLHYCCQGRGEGFALHPHHCRADFQGVKRRFR